MVLSGETVSSFVTATPAPLIPSPVLGIATAMCRCSQYIHDIADDIEGEAEKDEVDEFTGWDRLNTWVKLSTYERKAPLPPGETTDNGRFKPSSCIDMIQMATQIGMVNAPYGHTDWRVP